MTDLNEGRESEHGAPCQSIHAVPFFDILIDAIPCPIYYKDTKGVYIGYDKAFGDKILGPNGCRIIGRRMSEFDKRIPSELLELTLRKDFELLKNPERQVYEISMSCADGKVRHFAIHKSTYADPEGNLAGIIGIMLDISAAKKAQSQLIEYRDHLERTVAERSADLINIKWISETHQVVASMLDVTTSNQMQHERNRLAEVIEQSAEAVIITDTHGRVEYTNPAFERLSGYSRE